MLNEQEVKEYLSKVAEYHGHKLIFYDEPKGDNIGSYDGIPIIVSRDVNE